MFSQEVITAAPHKSGVYLMLDEKSRVLYIGKAKDLHKRLLSYIRFSAAAHNKTSIMLEKTKNIDLIITNTEKEALLLESSLIKKHKPKYNILLRDDKSYPFIKVTVHEEWPRVFMVRHKSKDGARYFGPYSSSSAMWSTLRLISSLFPLRRCKDRQLKNRKRPCLNNQIGKCLAPCTGKTDSVRYQENVKKTIMVLEGRNKDVIDNLTHQMQEAATRLDFEGAVLFRDQISALSRTLEKQVISASHTKDQDAIGFARKNTGVTIAVLFIRNGLITGSRSFFLLDPYGDDKSILSQALVQFYGSDTILPKEILLPFEPDDLNLHNEYLNEGKAHQVRISIPKRGDKLRLVHMASTNALQFFEEKEQKANSWTNLAETLQSVLRLNRTPNNIECLDISNTSGKQAVGSLVCFTQGEPDKKRYRHYKIRTIDSPNDYAMMQEVLYRRLKRGLEENNLPDLFIVDGGKGQLAIATRVAEELGVFEDIDWLGIAKERKEEGEKLYKPQRKNPILLPSHNPVLLFMMRIRDESHRYGITFHRKLRLKSTLSSELDEIPGIGKEKKRSLLKQMGSLKRIREATQDELIEVKGVGRELASKIYGHFHSS